MQEAHHVAEQNDQHTTDTGEIIINPRGLNIVWGNDSRYWHLPEKGKSPAELLQVCWLEVNGTSPDLDSGKKYKINFSISLRQDAFGWKGCPVFMMAKIGKKGKYSWKRVLPFDQITPDSPTEIPGRDDKFEIEVPQSATDKKLYFGLYEVWSGKWKGGLKIHHVSIKEAE